jgi:hypothetical protein
MGQPKHTIHRYVRFKDDSWRYCRAALYANRTIKPHVVTVGGREEKHTRRATTTSPAAENGFLPGLTH